MKIHEDRSHMNIDTRWFEKGYAKEDVHSLRLQSLCTEAEAAANKQFYDSHTREEWDQYIRQASLESSAAMKPVMEAIAQDFVCYQYDENIPVSYGSDRWTEEATSLLASLGLGASDLDAGSLRTSVTASEVAWSI